MHQDGINKGSLAAQICHGGRLKKSVHTSGMYDCHTVKVLSYPLTQIEFINGVVGGRISQV